jgi:hypothetical protein
MNRFTRWTLVLGSVAALALAAPADAEARGGRGGGGGRSPGGSKSGGAKAGGGSANKAKNAKGDFLESLQRDEADEERGGFRDDAAREVIRRLRGSRRGA